jgi:hypothetical protein
LYSRSKAATGFSADQPSKSFGKTCAALKKCRPDWDITQPELKAAWERHEHDRFYPYGRTYGQVFREQE